MPGALPAPVSSGGDPVSTWTACKRIYRHLTGSHRRQGAATMVLLLAGAVAELATIGAVLPFLALITPGGLDTRYRGIGSVLDRLGAIFGIGSVAVAALLLIAVAVLATIIRLLLVWYGQKLVFTVAHELASQIYATALARPYSYHVASNSSDIIAGIEKVQFVLSSVLMPAMLAVTAAFVGTFMLIGLIVIDPVTACLLGACFGALYACVSIFSRKRLHENAAVISAAFRGRIQVVQEGLGGIRDVILDRSQPIFAAKFAAIDGRFRRAQAANQFMAVVPRYTIESGSIILLAVTAIVVSTRPGGIVAALQMLGALALGAQRLLPMIQQLYQGWTQIAGARGAMADIAALLDADRDRDGSGVAVAPLSRDVTFTAVAFRYSGGSQDVLRCVDLVIPRGARIGLVGRSGSGKSTFVDLLMGLLIPTGGEIRVDGLTLNADALASWQAQIAHVPQAIFLTDGSIAANIAFGREPDDIDRDRVREAARLAELDGFIATLQDGYDTLVGERGVRLSGGQRQRIGIARAMYKQARVLVLDEATSALDAQTEASVIEAIRRLPGDLTVVAIAHRTSTLSFCDQILRVENGAIVPEHP